MEPKHTGTKIIAFLALVLSIIALTLGWIAYNRTGADLEQQIQNQVQRATNNAEEAAGDAANETQEAADQAENNLDAGPDGVDQDDTQNNTNQ